MEIKAPRALPEHVCFSFPVSVRMHFNSTLIHARYYSRSLASLRFSLQPAFPFRRSEYQRLIDILFY